MDLDDWHKYILGAFPAVSPSAIRIEQLAGGIVNSTVRLTVLHRVSDITRRSAVAGDPLPSSTLDHSANSVGSGDAGVLRELAWSLEDLVTEIEHGHRVSDSANTRTPSDSPPPPTPNRPATPLSASFSLILKHAPAHMPNEPDTPLSRFRQTAEARALRHLHSDPALAAVLAETGLKIPRVVWHDQERHVLWITDLGRIRTLTDVLNETHGTVDRQSATVETASVEDESEGHDIANGARSAKPAVAGATPSSCNPRHPAVSYARLVGLRLGSALARLHLAAQSPNPALLDLFKDPAPVGPGVPEYLATMVRNLLHEYGHADAEALAKRVGLGISAPAEDGLVVWSIADLWPGSVLLGTTPAGDGDTWPRSKSGTSGMQTTAKSKTIIPELNELSSSTLASIEMALVDWEFAGEQHPGAEVGMMLAHLRVHALKGVFSADSSCQNTHDHDGAASSSRNADPVSKCPSASASVAVSAAEGPIAVTTEPIIKQHRSLLEQLDAIDDMNMDDHVAQGFIEGYHTAAPELVRSRSFPREMLQAYGREMVNAAEFNAGEGWGRERKQHLVAEGALCLRAAGTRDAETTVSALSKITKAEGGPYVYRLLALSPS